VRRLDEDSSRLSGDGRSTEELGEASETGPASWPITKVAGGA